MDKDDELRAKLERAHSNAGDLLRHELLREACGNKRASGHDGAYFKESTWCVPALIVVGGHEQRISNELMHAAGAPHDNT